MDNDTEIELKIRELRQKSMELYLSNSHLSDEELKKLDSENIELNNIAKEIINLQLQKLETLD